MRVRKEEGLGGSMENIPAGSLPGGILVFFLILACLMGPERIWAGGPDGGYKVLRKIALPGNGGWDFLAIDNKARRLYVTHNDGVQVLDADSYKLIGTVEGIQHPHGVVILPQAGKGYATSGEPGSVVVFGLKTLKRLSEIPSAKDTDVILYDKSTGNILTFNGDSRNSTVIDPSTDRAIRTVDWGGSPEVAVADGKGSLYDNLNDKNLVLMIDSKTLKVERRWPTAPGTAPTGLALDSRTHRLFIGCRNRLLLVMDATNGRILQTLPIGDHVDGALFDPATGNVFVSCGDGTLSVVHGEAHGRYHVVETVPTEPGARTLALDPRTGRLFLPTAKRLPPGKPSSKKPKPRGKLVPGSFEVLVVGR